MLKNTLRTLKSRKVQIPPAPLGVKFASKKATGTKKTKLWQNSGSFVLKKKEISVYAGLEQ
ncbi:hypothetical protein RG47T_1195 [Mucilaginibacter polytrichastri]|uniref:Uncharacterized protein n=1 Tax=Mucilaginibacter polytrichastri TaxID=1302689 RepID=A0A1Q5ZVF4_9SPHI|nr:hypothetical protein RG47T_1195 [Mucilaginibacter polytrichastri]